VPPRLWQEPHAHPYALVTAALPAPTASRPSQPRPREPPLRTTALTSLVLRPRPALTRPCFRRSLTLALSRVVARFDSGRARVVPANMAAR
jgi:hypothetical protein